MMTKLKIILFLCTILISCLESNKNFNKENESFYLYRHKLGEQYGYKDSKGNMIIPYGKYSWGATDTIKTIGFVMSNDLKVYVVNNKGEEIFQLFGYGTNWDSEREGLIRIIGDNNNIGFIDMNGELVIPPSFKFANSFSEGLASFEIGGEKSDPISRIGGEPPEEFHEIDYKELSLYNKKNNIRYGFIDKKGKVVIEAKFDWVFDFKDGRALVYKDGREFYIDKKGNEILDITN